jgi:Ran GTPase-activating protein (RanGAP) involved in mRNA processing and transport
LNVSSNKITHLGLSHLVQALERNCSIIDLNLANNLEGNCCNRIGYQGAEVLAKLLRNQKFLQILNITGNSIGDRGFKALCDILPHNDTLISLNVEKNQITQSGVIHLAKLYKSKKINLNCLSLNKNACDCNAIEELFTIICEKALLSHLYLSETGIDAAISNSIFTSLRYN